MKEVVVLFQYRYQTFSLVIVRFCILYGDIVLTIVVLLGSFCSLKEGIFESPSGH